MELTQDDTAAGPPSHPLKTRRVGIDTYNEAVVFLHRDSPVCRAEGFEAQARVRVSVGGRSLIATLYVVFSDWLSTDEIGLSETAWAHVGAREEGQAAIVTHPEPLESFSAVRAKLYGTPFTPAALGAVMRDVAGGRYSAVELAAFVTVCASQHLDEVEMLALTRSMIDTGTRMAWPASPVVDKHCIGGLAGNRTTPIVVAIAAACGLTIPKTSSRAITSPSGTADAMEMLAPVDLTPDHMRRVVEREGGCVVWGGAMALAPADDVLIRVERPLDIDGNTQVVASIIAKKVAAGSTHLLVDIPVGPTAKVRSAPAATGLEQQLVRVGEALGLRVRVRVTDGSQPIGRGVGPALEANDVLAVLRNEAGAPVDLRDRALLLSGELLELAGRAAAGHGLRLARETLSSGAAWKKFLAICEAQGGLRTPPKSSRTWDVVASCGGQVRAIDNRRLSKAAKLAGAPIAPAAGIYLHARTGERVVAGQPLFTLHAQSPGELAYARAYIEAQPGIVFVDQNQEHST